MKQQSSGTFYDLINGLDGRSRNHSLAAIISAIRNENITELYPRYRDCFLPDDDGHIKNHDYLIYTRMGGGNYSCWSCYYEECNDGKNEDPKKICPYHQLLELEKDPRYLWGYDDDYDCTYRTLVFKFTAEERKLFKKFKSGDKATIKLLNERLEVL